MVLRLVRGKGPPATGPVRNRLGAPAEKGRGGQRIGSARPKSTNRGRTGRPATRPAAGSAGRPERPHPGLAGVRTSGGRDLGSRPWSLAGGGPGRYSPPSPWKAGPGRPINRRGSALSGEVPGPTAHHPRGEPAPPPEPIRAGTPAVHPRPDADRHHRHRGAREDPRHRQERSFRFVQRPDLLQPAPRGRDQPDPAQDPGRAARGDAGAPGHRSPAASTPPDADAPFFVLATQNPIEQEGTYPLPEAQLDRFMFRTSPRRRKGSPRTT